WQTTSTPAAIRPAATKPQSWESNRMPRTYACIPCPPLFLHGGGEPPPPFRRRGYFTESASSISFLPFGTSLANSAYELSSATLSHWSYSCGVSVTTSTL